MENLKRNLLENSTEEVPEDLGSADERFTTLQTLHNHISSKNCSLLIKKGLQKMFKEEYGGALNISEKEANFFCKKLKMFRKNCL